VKPFRKVPFMGGGDRFKKEWPINVQPGPGSYEPLTTSTMSTKSDLHKGGVEGANFKSKSPKISLYTGIEKEAAMQEMHR